MIYDFHGFLVVNLAFLDDCEFMPLGNLRLQLMLVFHCVLERHWKTLVTPFCGRCQNFSLLIVKVESEADEAEPRSGHKSITSCFEKRSFFSIVASARRARLAQSRVPLPLKGEAFCYCCCSSEPKFFFSIPSCCCVCLISLALIYCYKKFLESARVQTEDEEEAQLFHYHY